RELGAIMTDRLHSLAAQLDVIADVRGRGAMVAIEFAEPDSLEPIADLPKRIAAACAQQGVMVLTAGTYGNVIRLLPPLVMSDELITDAMDVITDAILTEAAK
nr:aminotransferase class III-fold pyridoxal phosphate-dependent enzyme [Actinomycetes bacterium]